MIVRIVKTALGHVLLTAVMTASVVGTLLMIGTWQDWRAKKQWVAIDPDSLTEFKGEFRAKKHSGKKPKAISAR